MRDAVSSRPSCAGTRTASDVSILLEAGFYIHPLRKAGVKLVTVAQGTIDWDDFAGRLVYSVTQEAKHAFLRDLSRNMLRGRIAAAKRGEWLSPAPLGYSVENKRLVLGDPQDVATVRRIFRDYLGGHSLRAIAVTLNAEGIQDATRQYVGLDVRSRTY